MTILKSACLLLVSAAAAICADPGSISGKVLTAAGNGAAVPNASVEGIRQTNPRGQERYAEVVLLW